MSTSSSVEGSTTTGMTQTQIAQSRWEQAQEKAFLNWVNSLLIKKNLKIENIATDFSDGTKLIYFLELVSNKKCRRKFNPEPKDKINRIQNISIALWFIEEDLNIKNRGIGAEDFHDGNKKIILGFLWTLYRKRIFFDSVSGSLTNNSSSTTTTSTNNSINQEQLEAEANLLKWCSNLTGINVTQFKNGFKDGMAFLSMVKQLDEGSGNSSSSSSSSLLFDDLASSGVDSIARLNAVFDYAEKNLNIPKLLDAEDLVNGVVDDRTVMLYTSMFYNAYEIKKKKQKGETELLMEQVKEVCEKEQESIKKLFELEDQLRMYQEELRIQRFERMVMEKMIRDQENQELLSNLLLLRDQLEDHQIKLCKLQQKVQEEASGKRAPLWGAPQISADLSKDQYEQIQILGDLLDDESNRINRIVQLEEVKPIQFLKNKNNNNNNNNENNK